MFERGLFSLGAPLEDAVVRLIGEKNISVGIAARSFGKNEINGELFHYGDRFDDRWHFVIGLRGR